MTGEGFTRWDFAKAVAGAGGFVLAFIYMPEPLRDIPVVRAIFVMVVAGFGVLIVDLLRAAFFPRDCFDRLFFALLAAVIAIGWHKLLYELGLTENDVEEHYRTLNEARGAELKETQ